MKIGFAPTVTGIDFQRRAFDSVSGAHARVFTTSASPHRPDDDFDVILRYAEYGNRADSFVVQEYHRAEGEIVSGDVAVYLERVHLY